MRDFYMTLLSNSSMVQYPSNKTSSFTVHLPRYMSLDSHWEVGLAEILYPYTFANVTAGQSEIQLETIEITDDFIKWYTTNSNLEVVPPFEHVKSKHNIIQGFYENVEEIISSVNEVIAEYTKQPTFFEYKSSPHRIGTANDFIEVGRKFIISCKLSPRLSLQLGYRPDELILPTGQYSSFVTNATVIPGEMLIYCDILEPQIIGDTWGKVLRIVTSDPGHFRPYFGQQCSVTFTQPHYIPVQQTNFETISIDIRDINGKLLPFQHGTLSVKLHFRKRY